MKILLTGSSGFLGNALALALQAEGHNLVLPLRQMELPQGLHPSQNQVIPIEGIEKLGVPDWQRMLNAVDAVIHAAAIAHIGSDVSALTYQSVNRDASVRLADAAATAGLKKFVFLSSIRAQIGPSSSVIQNEDTMPAPTEDYGRSKLDAELAIRAALPSATILRPALILGENPRGNLAKIVRLARLPMPLPFSSLKQPQAVVCRANVVEAILLAMHNLAMQGETFVLADSEHPSLAEIFAAIRNGMNRKPNLLPFPNALLSQALGLVGAATARDRIFGGLRVDATKLRRFGWTQVQKPEDVFWQLGKN